MKKLFVFLSLICCSLVSSDDVKKPVRVYVDVVGDLFHAGHVQFFKNARALGDYLIVGIHDDAEVVDYKRQPILSMEERRIAIEACRYVDEVIVNTPLRMTEEWIEKYKIDLVVHGDDFSEENKNAHYAVPVRLGIFKTIPYTKGISTSDLIERIKNRQFD